MSTDDRQAAQRRVNDLITLLRGLPSQQDQLSGLIQEAEALARAIAASKAFSLAGGGDTIAAIHKFGVAGDIDYISTAGGAFLEFLEGKPLPAVAALEARADG